jgi:hypothetical protein
VPDNRQFARRLVAERHGRAGGRRAPAHIGVVRAGDKVKDRFITLSPSERSRQVIMTRVAIIGGGPGGLITAY